ncbi:hypothetical protein Amsp01_060590 [Amycolatopsis sp. NBRC 101858]|uniref:hypothetical protein n=1 Tax=Amycolatopsis sp. NBRC 101858 TaxID=3032200 RepID=UPI0024A18E8D|nr:hypothetical protein [Amycolatopsis sp. NBRC 101858]GLY40036.1 hypothetical protein Amsp01_060590 [Amycolatopsis sp. NBRC 101858]
MTGPLRPEFHEGQVLAAADLAATVSYARAAAVRHARLAHEWGIADGLALTTENRTDPATGARFVEVSVQAGLAVDGTGREIVVPAPVVLSEADFEAVNGADGPTSEPYPVFLTAADRARPATGPASCAGSAGPSRVEESYQILFKRLGDERLVADQQPPAVNAAPAAPPVPWLVLLGFVQWTAGHFTAAVPEARDVGPRFAGVRADTVAARSGSLSLRTRPLAGEGEPALVLSGSDTPALVYGLYRGTGQVDPLMTVESNGNLTIAGSFSGRISAGSVLATSGSATDGMVLPLPAGVTPEEVADGRVSLHVYVTPRIPPSGAGLTVPAEATVDGDRRVRCLLRSYDPGTGPAVTERPGSVDFLVLATVAATSGGG